MIRVTCDACGAGFNARDELAGRKGKCPKCQAPIVVPAADGPATATGPASAASTAGSPAAATAGSPAASTAGSPAASTAGSPAASTAAASVPAVSAGGGRRRSSSGGRRRGGSRSSGGGLNVVVVLAVVAGLAFAAWKMSTEEDPGAASFRAGMAAVQGGDVDAAIAAFERVPAESRFHAQAQQNLAEVHEGRDAAAEAAQTNKSSRLYQLIVSLEKNYVLGLGADHPDYAPNARYLLKQAAEFVERFPDNEHSATFGQYGFKYAKVASLDAPPTEDDVMAEMRFRCILTSPNFPAAGAAIDEFARSANGDPAAVRRMTDWLQEQSLAWWERVKDELRNSQRALEPGAENWQAIANATNQYLNEIRQVPGLTPSMEAQALYNKAINGGG